MMNKLYKYVTILPRSKIITTSINSTTTAQLHFQPTSSTSIRRSSFVPTQPSKCSSPSPPSLQLLLPSPWLRHRPLLAPPPWSFVTLRPSMPCRLKLRASWPLRKQLAAPSLVRYQHHNHFSSITDHCYRVHCCSCTHRCLLRCCSR
jgi:hypothetical protein